MQRGIQLHWFLVLAYLARSKFIPLAPEAAPLTQAESATREQIYRYMRWFWSASVE
mgnify:CR=1 FL=1